jgi:putative colanic acid biosynthesis UDP-glucose lipid carrier transferase
MLRHYVKPGITGLAQAKGYRGEIERNEDIVNRTRYDFFYIENWSMLLDLKIIFQTAINILKGEEKAY